MAVNLYYPAIECMGLFVKVSKTQSERDGFRNISSQDLRMRLLLSSSVSLLRCRPGSRRNDRGLVAVVIEYEGGGVGDVAFDSELCKLMNPLQPLFGHKVSSLGRGLSIVA